MPIVTRVIPKVKDTNYIQKIIVALRHTLKMPNTNPRRNNDAPLIIKAKNVV